MYNETTSPAGYAGETGTSSPLPLIIAMIVGLFAASFFVRSSPDASITSRLNSARPAAGVSSDVMPAAFRDNLPWNSRSNRVIEGPDGLQYIVLREGPAGGRTPSATDEVIVHYEGRRPNGEKFDSSYDRGTPAQFRLDQVIPGWTLGLQQMSEGDDYLFYIPNALAYGARDNGPVIKAGDDLIFRVELLEVRQPVSADADAWNTYLPWDPSRLEVVKRDSGLQYVVLNSGDPSGIPPNPSEMVLVHYEGRFAADGRVFDSSFARGSPETFPAGALIPGWVEALSLMRPGDRWMIYLPAELAYGPGGTADGAIPPNAALQFEVQLLDVLRQ